MDLAGEFLLMRSLVPGVDAEKADDVMYKIIDIRNEFIRRVGANGGKDPKLGAAYYKKLRSDFWQRVDEVLSDFEALTPKDWYDGAACVVGGMDIARLRMDSLGYCPRV